MEDESKVLIRLNSLMKSGYKIMERDSQELGDTLRLKHPATKRVKYREIVLYSDSSIVSGLSHIDGELSIPPENDGEFGKLIRETPLPTWWEKSEDSRVKAASWFLLGTILIGPALWGFIKKYV
ncbi:hypothetical protein [Plesiomonas shigelloides]|uniref:hypothetical protein n=1 Tax=Plesiomonas shigelloides TaxID=703 RepID=UPI00126140A6|nr:hypothetical protein [Plesiomonas shigelloides]KAB7696978.1 hypothetical protein GBN15_08510 [Plesiomonas shigelloides]